MGKHDRHHRKPRGHPCRSKYIAIVKKSQHQGWHNLTLGTFCPHEIAEIINDNFIDPDYEFIVRRRQ